MDGGGQKVRYVRFMSEYELKRFKAGEEPLKKSFGKYRDPERDKPKDLFEAIFKPTTPIDVPEYSTKTYSQNTMRIVKIGKVTSILGRKIKWEE